jgi:hypothetical protein
VDVSRTAAYRAFMRKLLFPVLVLLVLGSAYLAADRMSLPLVAEAQAASMVYHGNRKSHVFHRPGCRYYDCKNCVVVFHSRGEALKAGFRPCKICRP